MLKKLLTKSFFTRIISGILLVMLAAMAFLIGGNVLFVIIFMVSLIGMFELYRVFDIQKRLPGILGYGAAFAYYLLLYTENQEHMMVIIIGFLMMVMAAYVFTFPIYRSEQIFAAFLGLIYVAVMLSYVYQTRALEEGEYLVWLVFLSSWMCDTCAYFFGVLFGKHKLAPILSPKKSIEGSIGGTLGSFVLGGVFGYVFFNQLQATFLNPVVGCALVCGAASVISQIGDLTASAIKRNHEVKDYGNLIPGHGGILDRFDSVIFVAPAIYYLCVFIN